MRASLMPCRHGILGLLALLAWPCLAGEQAVGPLDFSLPRLGGGDVALSDYRGEWVVVNYWATWCAPCRKEIPDLSRLHERREDVTVLGLAFEDTDEASFLAFLGELGASYPILRVDVYHPPEPFGAPKVLPTTYLLSPGGCSVKAFLGPVTGEDIEKFIDASEAGTGDVLEC